MAKTKTTKLTKVKKERLSSSGIAKSIGLTHTKKKAISNRDSKKTSKMKTATKAVTAEIVEDSEPTDLNHTEYEKAYTLPIDSDRDNKLGSSFESSAISDDEPLIKESHLNKKKLNLIGTSKAITSADPLAIYLNEIRRYKVLTKEEETALAKKYFESKDPEVAQDLVKANLRFVVKIAAEYSKFGAKMIDLIQEGNVGLMHAVREFNPYKGARLITYAVWWIRGYIQEYLMRQYSMVRIGTTQNQRKLFYQLQKEKDALDALGADSSMALLSSRLGIPEDEVRDMAMRMSGRDLSLDRPLDEDSNTNLGDIQRNSTTENLDDHLANQEQIEILKRKIEEIRPELSEREKIILDERLLNDEPLTLQEIGEKHGITREAVRQMESRVLKKIKTKMES